MNEILQRIEENFSEERFNSLIRLVGIDKAFEIKKECTERGITFEKYFEENPFNDIPHWYKMNIDEEFDVEKIKTIREEFKKEKIKEIEEYMRNYPLTPEEAFNE